PENWLESKPAVSLRTSLNLDARQALPAENFVLRSPAKPSLRRTSDLTIKAEGKKPRLSF
ncbi:MAG: hypothetical protein WCA47_04425, partial [Terriglobales bacterium]